MLQYKTNFTLDSYGSGASGRVYPWIELQDAKLLDFTVKVYQFAIIKRTGNV